MNEPPSTLRVELLGPEMSSFGDLETVVHAEPGLEHRFGDEIPVIFPLELRFDADRAGNHSAEIYSDDRHQTSVFFVVRESEQQNADLVAN